MRTLEQAHTEAIVSGTRAHNEGIKIINDIFGKDKKINNLEDFLKRIETLKGSDLTDLEKKSWGLRFKSITNGPKDMAKPDLIQRGRDLLTGDLQAQLAKDQITELKK